MLVMEALFSSKGLMPHGFCYQWNPFLIWLHSISDMLIAIAYFSIPPTLIYLVRKKRNIPFDWMFVCFGVFIAACGATHLMEIVTLWIPMYWLSGGVKIITAFASLPTAVLLARVVPRVLELPTAQELRAAHEELRAQAYILREQAALMDLSQDAIFVQTIGGENLLWNQGAEHLYGWTKVEAVGANGHQLLETRFSQPLDEILNRLETTGYWEGQLQKKRRDGQTIVVSSRWALGRGQDGSPNKILVIDTDITEQRRAEAALRESEDRYRDLVENSHDLICTHDLQGRLLSVNDIPAKILGYSREELLNKPMRDFLLPEARTEFDQYLSTIQETGSAKGALAVLTKGGERRIWEYQNTLRTDGVATPVVRGIAHDITERKLAEKALRLSEEKFSKAFRSSPSVLSISSLVDGRFIDVNEGFERLSGYLRREIIGHTSLELNLWRDPGERQTLLEEITKHGHIRDCEVHFYAKSGKPLVLMLSGEIIELAGEKCLLKVGQDITGRKRAEEALQRLSGRLLQLQDEERRKIARDLHDATGQDLVALSGTLSHLHATVSSSSRKVRRSIAQCLGLADRCIREIRTLSYLLHPPMLDEAGLEDAIRHYLTGFAERTGIEAKLQVRANFGRLAQEEEMALFRVMQESLVNIHRHSGSFNATIFLDRTPKRVSLRVSDQGRGMQGNGQGKTKGSSLVGGVGIQSMHERMKQVAGQLEIESSTKGTTVLATIPTNA